MESGQIKDEWITATHVSNSDPPAPPANARLNKAFPGWLSTPGHSLMIDVGRTVLLTHIGTQSYAGKEDEMVQIYTLKYALEMGKWMNHTDNGIVKVSSDRLYNILD